jgi:hypothetical protein
MYRLPPKRLVWFAAGGAKFQQIPARPSNFDTDEWNEQGYVSADKHTSRSASSTLVCLAAFAEELRRTRRKPTTICSRSKSNAIET